MMLSIIIPTKDRHEIFSQTLQAAVAAITDVEAEIIIVNDSRTNVPVIPQTGNVTLLQNVKAGVAAARNLGFKYSKGRIILFLDNDIIISTESIKHILNLHSTYTDACFNLNWEYSPETINKIGAESFSRFLKKYGMTSFKGWYNDATWKDRELFKSKSVASFHLSMRRENFEATGGYNEQFQHAGFEDYDFPLRLQHAGIQFYIDSRITVYHNEVDRLQIENWLINQERRAETRRKAVSLGYVELALIYPPIKKLLLQCVLRSEEMLMGFTKCLPNYRVFDPVYFKLISVIQASRIFKGYTSG